MAGIGALVIAGLLHIAAGAAEAALQYVGGTSGSGTATTYNVSLNGTLTGGLATSPAAGDIVIVVTGWASTANGNPGVTAPTGYTEVYDGYANHGTQRDANLSVSYKIMPGTPDTSVTVSGFNNAANGGATAVHVWRGVDQTTPMDVTPPSSPAGVTAITGSRPDSPAITPLTSGAVVLAVGLGTGAATPTAMTAPTGFINGRSVIGTGTTMGAVANIASQAWAGGAVDPAAWTGGTTSANDSWVAGTLALRPAIDALSVTGNTPIASSASLLATDVQMQRLQVDSSTGDNNNTVINSITVDDLGTAGATDITNLKIHIDSDTNFGNGVLGTVTQAGFTGSSTPISLTALSAAIRTVTNGTSKYIWITYDLAASAAGKSIRSSVTAIAVDLPDTGATGTWNSNLISVDSGPSSTISNCIGCHGGSGSFVDSSTRDAVAGTFRGDHAKHNYVCTTCHTDAGVNLAHRDGNINMASPIFNAGGTYTLGTTFPQRNDYVATPTGSCTNVNCHSGAATPQWGVGTTVCNSCHNTPPNTDAHTKHYTAKGWANDTANCTVCHPDNSTTHSNVTDNNVTVNGTLIPTGTSPAITCASTPTGCHNGKATPAWNTTGISCSNCHAIGGGAAGDPTSGLHDATVAMAHDNQFLNTPVEGAPGTATCVSCHSSTSPSSLHFDGTVQNAGAATYTWNTTKIPAGYVRATDDCAATCHTDAGTWQRRWSTAVDGTWAYGNDAASATVCGNCHGSFFTGWNIVGATDHVNPDVDNDPDTLATSKSNHGECSKCHGWGHTNYSTGTKHENNTLEMNSTLDTTPGDGNCTTNCHAGLTLTMNGTSGWTDASVVGDGVACGDCHAGGVTRVGASGAHASHGATASLLTANPASVAMCVNCHGNDGTGATHNNGTVNWQTNLTYSQAASRGNLTGTCSGTAGCHVAATNIAWNDLNPTNCNQCHYNTTETANWGWTGTAGNISMISSTQYTAVGHGQATINGAAANKDCMACHDINQAHDTTATLTGSNPFRLKVGFTCNDSAAGCHTVSGTFATHDQATAGKNYTWGFGAKCVDCHDPHGDGSNLAMIHSDLADKGSQTNGVRNTPDAAIETMVFTSTAGTAADSYAEPSTTFDGICQECHTLTTSFRDNTSVASGTHASNTTGCMNCHNHKNDGFKGSGCNGCHGGDNATLSNKNFWPSGAGAAWPDRPGEHDVHVTRLALKLYNESLAQIVTDTGTTSEVKQKTICSYCHGSLATIGASGHYTDNAPTGQADVPSFLRIWSGAADAGTVATYTSPNCFAVDCHNEKDTNAGGNYGWYAGATSACVSCHTVGAANNPNSGLHTAGVATVTGKEHDNTLSGVNSMCEPCHTPPAYSQSGTHINGTFTGNWTIANPDRTALGLFAAYTGTADGVGTCSGAGVSTGCHAGSGDNGTWARKWDSSIHYVTTGAECNGCHGGVDGLGWNTGVLNHDQNWNSPADAVADEIIGNHGGNTGQNDRCRVCHVYNDTTNSTYTVNAGGKIGWFGNTSNSSTYHGNGSIDFNINRGYSSTTWDCTSTCHTAGGSHAMADSGWTTIANVTGSPDLACTDCHTGSGTGALKVGPSSSHVKRGTKTTPTNYSTFNACTDCHPSTKHNGIGDSTKVFIAENTTVGINYTAVLNNAGTSDDEHTNDGGTTAGFWLGGTATTGSTEAEICWNCHNNTTTYQITAISEWGTNTKQTGAPAALAAYNYGTVSTPNWTTATWTSANFSYKTAAIQSTHSVNSAGTSTATATAGYFTETKDSVGNIRCSYCHDVHDTASGVVTGDVSGKPFLRGTWWTNPYKEDGAPTTASTTYYAAGNFFGGVPRGWHSTTLPANTSLLGGWQIDQNNNNPTVSTGYTGVNWTTTNSAGLCMLCHTSGVDAMNQNTTENGGASLWVGTNGHSNAVIGGTGSAKANIYNPTTRNEGTLWTNPTMGYQSLYTSGGANGSDRMYGLRNYSGNTFDTTTYPGTNITTDNNAGVSPYAVVATSAQVRYAYQAGRGSAYDSVWGVDRSTTTAQTQYHKFSCSKCHNPHASRLPKLMITNCLDISHNTWDDLFSGDPDWTSGAANGTVTDWSTVGIFPTGTETALNNKEFAYAKSAQNCHRFIDNNGNGTITTGDTGGDEPGWNKVTPWK